MNNANSIQPMMDSQTDLLFIETETCLKDLNTACQPFIKDKSNKRESLNRLRNLAATSLGQQNLRNYTAIAEQFFVKYSALNAEEQPAWTEVLRFNIACAACFLYHYLNRPKRTSPQTLRTYCSRLSNIIRKFPETCLNDLSTNFADEIMAMDYEDKTRAAMRSMWKSIFKYMQKELLLPVSPVDWKSLNIQWRLTEASLIGQKNVERVLEHLDLAAKNELCAMNTYYAVLLGFFWGLRLSEVENIRIGDFVLESAMPFINIRHAKGNKRRRVYCNFVPDSVMEAFHKIINQRFMDCHDLNAHLLVDQNKIPQKGNRISKKFISTLIELGIREANSTTHSLVFHTLRHEYANRFYILANTWLKNPEAVPSGLKPVYLKNPLIDLAISMGHSSADTTIQCYLHCFDYLTIKTSQSQPFPVILPSRTCYYSQNQIASQLGITRRHVTNLIDEAEKQLGRPVRIRHSQVFPVPKRGKDEVLVRAEDCLYLSQWYLGDRNNL